MMDSHIKDLEKCCNKLIESSQYVSNKFKNMLRNKEKEVILFLFCLILANFCRFRFNTFFGQTSEPLDIEPSAEKYFI